MIALPERGDRMSTTEREPIDRGGDVAANAAVKHAPNAARASATFASRQAWYAADVRRPS